MPNRFTNYSSLTFGAVPSSKPHAALRGFFPLFLLPCSHEHLFAIFFPAPADCDTLSDYWVALSSCRDACVRTLLALPAALDACSEKVKNLLWSTRFSFLMRTLSFSAVLAGSPDLFLGAPPVSPPSCSSCCARRHPPFFLSAYRPLSFFSAPAFLKPPQVMNEQLSRTGKTRSLFSFAPFLWPMGGDFLFFF